MKGAGSSDHYVTFKVMFLFILLFIKSKRSIRMPVWFSPFENPHRVWLSLRKALIFHPHVWRTALQRLPTSRWSLIPTGRRQRIELILALSLHST